MLRLVYGLLLALSRSIRCFGSNATATLTLVCGLIIES